MWHISPTKRQCPALAKSVINVEIRIILVLNVGPNSQEEETDDLAAHPEDVRTKTNVNSPGREVTRGPKVHIAWNESASFQDHSGNLHGDSADLHGQQRGQTRDLHGAQGSTEFLKQSFSTISRSKSVSSISNDTDPEGKTKILTMLQIKLPHHNGADDVTVKVDDGAEGNILPLNSFRSMFPHALDSNGYPKPGFLRGPRQR